MFILILLVSANICVLSTILFNREEGKKYWSKVEASKNFNFFLKRTDF